MSTIAQRFTRALTAVAVALVALQVTVAQAQKIPPVPQPPRMPADIRSNIISGDVDWSGFARLNELIRFERFNEMNLIDMSRLTQQLNGLSQARLVPDLSGLRALSNLGSLGQTINVDGLASLSGLSTLSGLSDLSSLSGLSSLSNIGADMAPFANFGSGFSRGYLNDYSTGSYALPPESWQIKDPADSLYREARKALANDSYRRASTLYRQIRNTYPKSVYTADAGYWEAFSLQRLGNQDDLRAALVALNTQMNRFPNAPTKSEARSLQARLEGQLARMGDSKMAAGLGTRVDNVNNSRCPDDSEDERIDALDALIQMDAASAMPMLKKVLARRDECSANLRKKAIWLVSTRRAPDALDIMINAVRTDPDKDVRETAIFWMANYPSDRSTDLLIELAKAGNDQALRQRAVYSLAQVRNTKAMQALKDIVLDNSAPSDLRGDAVFWLVSAGRGSRGFGVSVGGSSGSTMGSNGITGTIGSTGGSGQNVVGTAVSGTTSGSGSGTNSQNAGRAPTEDVIPFLKEVYAKVDDRQVKERVLQAALQLRSEAARDWMVEIALNPKESSEARKAAVYSASVAGATTDQLQSVYDKANETDVRMQVLWLYSTRKTDGVDKLINVVRSEKNPELRKQAIFWVSRVKDPRVTQLLQEIIDK